jgi:hypothetical protein
MDASYAMAIGFEDLAAAAESASPAVQIAAPSKVKSFMMKPASEDWGSRPGVVNRKLNVVHSAKIIPRLPNADKRALSGRDATRTPSVISMTPMKSDPCRASKMRYIQKRTGLLATSE